MKAANRFAYCSPRSRRLLASSWVVIIIIIICNNNEDAVFFPPNRRVQALTMMDVNNDGGFNEEQQEQQQRLLVHVEQQHPDAVDKRLSMVVSASSDVVVLGNDATAAAAGASAGPWRIVHRQAMTESAKNVLQEDDDDDDTAKRFRMHQHQHQQQANDRLFGEHSDSRHHHVVASRDVVISDTATGKPRLLQTELRVQPRHIGLQKQKAQLMDDKSQYNNDNNDNDMIKPQQQQVPTAENNQNLAEEENDLDDSTSLRQIGRDDANRSSSDSSSHNTGSDSDASTSSGADCATIPDAAAGSLSTTISLVDDVVFNVDHLSDSQIRQLLQRFLADKTDNNNNKPPSSPAATTTTTTTASSKQQQTAASSLSFLDNEQGVSDIDDDDDDDDRTWVDVFGESAKEYLTQRMIPDTDIECRWDWRSIRCEPACQCHLDLQLGDYHLGRSCRFRKDDDDHDDDMCLDIHPAMFLRELPIPKRMISLSMQSLDIIKLQSQQAVQTVRRQFNLQLRKIQQHVCHDLWELRKQAMQQQEDQEDQQEQNDSLFHLPPRQRLPVHVAPTRHSIAEKFLCVQQNTSRLRR